MEKPIRVGDLLHGKYRVERELGRGGMGVVLAVRHRRGELFAMKVLLAHALADPSTVERFVREGRAVKGFSSDHVAKVHHVGHFESGAPYMIMEHLEGSDLAALLRARGALPMRDAIEYVLQACEAISEAHAAGIVHRDIKLGNLFLTRRPDGRPLVKVLDFGIAKHRDTHGEVDAEELTRTGVMLGSPSYMSPEQMRHTRTVDGRGDVWSMGVVLYKLVTGVAPFQGNTISEIISSVLDEEPELPSSVRRGLPAKLDVFLTRALEKEAASRFQSIDEFAAALVALRDDPEGPAVVAPAPPKAGTDPVPVPWMLDETVREAGRAPPPRKRNDLRHVTMVTAIVATLGFVAVGARLVQDWSAPASTRPALETGKGLLSNDGINAVRPPHDIHSSTR